MSTSGRSHRSSTSTHHSASRPRTTASAPSSTYFSAASLPPFNKSSSRSIPSAYKRSPRPNFLIRAWDKIRKLVRDFIRYARKNPLKVIVPLIMALMGGGALTGLVKRMGGLQALGLGGLGRGFDLNQLIGAGHGIRTASNAFAGMGRAQEEGMGSFDAWSMGKGAIKLASAFL